MKADIEKTTSGETLIFRELIGEASFDNQSHSMLEITSCHGHTISLWTGFYDHEKEYPVPGGSMMFYKSDIESLINHLSAFLKTDSFELGDKD